MNARSIVVLSIVFLVLTIAVAEVVLTDFDSQDAQATPPTVLDSRQARSDWYDIYFTTPRFPDVASSRSPGIDRHLVNGIDQARRTLDVAVYDFDLTSVAEAMARAQGRGVRVRVVTDTDTLTKTKDEKIQAAFAIIRSAGIPIVDDQRQSIMHHKFSVIDDEWVSLGSWNYTEGDTHRSNNWMGIFRSPELARRYTAEFERMFVDRKFGRAKPSADREPGLIVAGRSVETCFSPKQNCAGLVTAVVRNETRSIVRFLAFSFTHDDIGDAMIERANAGVTIRGVFESTGSQTQFSEYGRLKEARADVYTDGNPYQMHHKTITIDGQIVVTGSFNFSANANLDNDENLLLIRDQALAELFDEEFERVLHQAKNPPARSK
jgi:phosphatidylserine/phosphatidylglycerophosphate/cardiolipin synthase-like enzyme